MFAHHLRQAGEKAKRVARNLGRLMPNLCVLKEPRRKLLVSIVNLVLIYDAPVWGSATMLRTIAGYCNISLEVELALTTAPPLHLVA